MIYIHDQFATVWKFEDKGKYTEVQMSTSRKDKQSGEYINSGWSFVSFVGDAHKKASDLERGSRIKLQGGISKEPYMKDGEKLYPKNPRIVVFNFEFVEGGSSKSDDDSGPQVENDGSSESDELPF